MTITQLRDIATKTGQPYNLARVAVHEAGHALAVMRLGLIPLEGDISIFDEEEGPHGRAQLEQVEFGRGSTDKDISLHAEKEIIADLAGYAALMLLGEPEREACIGFSHDYRQAKGKIGYVNINHHTKQTLELLSEGTNPIALQLLATELLKYKTIGYGYAEQVVSVTDGESTWEEVLEAIEAQGERFIRE